MEQGTDKLNRVLYLPNNIAEVIHSDGITFNEALDDMHLDHPFEKYLPCNYNLHTTVEHLKHIYDTALILQIEIPKTYEFDEVLLKEKNSEYMRKNMVDVWEYLYKERDNK